MINKIPCYQTSDGTVHFSEIDAITHERTFQFRQWYENYCAALNSPVDASLLNAILAHFDPLPRIDPSVRNAEKFEQDTGIAGEKLVSALEFTTRIASAAKLVADTGTGKEIDPVAAADAVSLLNEMTGGLRTIFKRVT